MVRLSSGLVVAIIFAGFTNATEPLTAEKDSTKGPERASPIRCTVRVLAVREDFFERIGIEWKSPTTLSDRQLSYLLEAVSGDPFARTDSGSEVLLLENEEVTLRNTVQRKPLGHSETLESGAGPFRVNPGKPIETGTTLTLSAKKSMDQTAVTLRASYQEMHSPKGMSTKIKPARSESSIEDPQVETLTLEQKITLGSHAIFAGPQAKKKNDANTVWKNAIDDDTSNSVKLRTILILSPVNADSSVR